MEKNLKDIGFDRSEAQFFSYLYKRLDQCDKNLFEELGAEYSTDKSVADLRISVEEKLKPLAEKYQYDATTIYMLFFASHFENMRKKYMEKGVSEEIFYDSMKDFKYKLNECKKYRGILGIIPFSWYHYFMRAEMYALGRLQFHRKKFFSNICYKWNDITITPDDTVVGMHIPSSGPLTREARFDSYKKAFDFFGKTKGDYLVLTCQSWLIYPGYKEVYEKGSNMAEFMDDFDIVSTFQCDENVFDNSRAVFGVGYNGDTSRFPTDTTLQRNFIKFLNLGKRTGHGSGVILFDGEKIVNKNGQVEILK